MTSRLSMGQNLSNVSSLSLSMLALTFNIDYSASYERVGVGTFDQPTLIPCASSASTRTSVTQKKSTVMETSTSDIDMARSSSVTSTTSKQSNRVKEALGRSLAKSGDRPVYLRKKLPRTHCHLCQEHPEGFRGDHELRRHISARHDNEVKTYICRDPATVGLVSNIQASTPLSDCKACARGKKYRAYYSAIMHLRRTHIRCRTDSAGPLLDDLRQWLEIAREARSTDAEVDEDEDDVTHEVTDDDVDPMDDGQRFGMVSSGMAGISNVSSSSHGSIAPDLDVRVDSIEWPDLDAVSTTPAPHTTGGVLHQSPDNGPSQANKATEASEGASILFHIAHIAQG